MIDKILQEYQSDEIKDNEEMYNLKQWIEKNLTEQEKRLLILYADLASLRKVAKLLNCSQCTVNNYLKKIREKIKNGYSKKPATDSNNSDNSN